MLLSVLIARPFITVRALTVFPSMDNLLEMLVLSVLKFVSKKYSNKLIWGHKYVVQDVDGFCCFFSYQIVLDSDDGLFGGFSRLDHDAEYFTAVSIGSEHYGCCLLLNYLHLQI